MPTSSGQNYLIDFVTELQGLGFDGYAVADLERYINRGYMRVARKRPWYWEETTDTFHLDPGQFSAPLWPLASGELPNFRSLDKLFITTPAYAGRVRPMDDEQFYTDWLSQDLTQTKLRGTPDKYFIHNQTLYLLTPPQVAMDFVAHYHRRVVPLDHSAPGTSDLPITPPHLDEAILRAALILCHERAKELTLAQQMRAELEEIFDDSMDDEDNVMAEVQERVKPDDHWL